MEPPGSTVTSYDFDRCDQCHSSLLDELFIFWTTQVPNHSEAKWDWGRSAFADNFAKAARLRRESQDMADAIRQIG
jgi:hypothetical protein